MHVNEIKTKDVIISYVLFSISMPGEKGISFMMYILHIFHTYFDEKKHPNCFHVVKKNCLVVQSKIWLSQQHILIAKKYNNFYKPNVKITN